MFEKQHLLVTHDIAGMPHLLDCQPRLHGRAAEPCSAVLSLETSDLGALSSQQQVDAALGSDSQSPNLRNVEVQRTERLCSELRTVEQNAGGC